MLNHSDTHFAYSDTHNRGYIMTWLDDSVGWKDIMPSTLRWILVLPAALGAYFGIQEIVGVASEFLVPIPFMPSDWEDVAQGAWSQGLNSVVGPIALIYAGALTSPKGYRVHTSRALAALFAAFSVIIAIVAIFVPIYPDSLYWWLLSTTGVSIITVIVVCIKIQRTEASRN